MPSTNKMTVYLKGSVYHAAPAPPAPPAPPATLRMLEYFVNNIHMGTLYLTQFAGSIYSDGRRCSWRSRETGQTTDWHGRWDGPWHGLYDGGQIECQFDRHGKDQIKWTVLNGPPLAMIGTDYKGRHIRAFVARTFLLNNNGDDWLLQSTWRDELALGR